MNKCYKENLQQLSKEQLIFLIENLVRSQTLIDEVCIEESKLHIDSDKAVSEIRNHLYHIPNMHSLTALKAYIDSYLK